MHYKRTLQILVITTLSAFFASSLGVIFIPLYGIVAGAGALLAGNILISVLNTYMVKKIIKMEKS